MTRRCGIERCRRPSEAANNNAQRKSKTGSVQMYGRRSSSQVNKDAEGTSKPSSQQMYSRRRLRAVSGMDSAVQDGLTIDVAGDRRRSSSQA